MSLHNRCCSLRSAAILAISAPALLTTSCNSAAEMRYWCLTQANRAVSGSSVDSEADERRVQELYLRCLEAQGVPDAEPQPPQG